MFKFLEILEKLQLKFSIKSINVEIDFWYLLFIAVIAISYSLQLAFFTCLVGICILLHEFGHVYQVKKCGANVEKVVLYPFGGIAYVNGTQSLSHKNLFLVSVMGPVVSVLLAIIMYIMWLIFSIAVFQHLAYVNLFIVLFNLIPIYPLDGGQMLYSALSMVILKQKFAIELSIIISLISLSLALILFFMLKFWFAFIILLIFGILGVFALKTKRDSLEIL